MVSVFASLSLSLPATPLMIHSFHRVRDTLLTIPFFCSRGERGEVHVLVGIGGDRGGHGGV